ncbi:MAG: NAD(P)/FAD-dependent oxidoreductase [Pseudomonadota bacterium]
MQRYDTIVVGAGHNGLVCAASLAKAGQSVLVLEASDGPGGLAGTYEFHPGYRASLAHSMAHFSPKVTQELNLTRFGFDDGARPLALVGLDREGNHVVVEGEAMRGASDRDASAFKQFVADLSRFASALSPFWEKTMPRLSDRSLRGLSTFAQLGLNLRRLGKQDMAEFLRIASLCARDLVDERFEQELVKAMLCWDGLIGARMAPRSPNSAVLAMLYRAGSDFHGAHRMGTGGVRALVYAIAAAAEDAGAQIRYDSPVARITLDNTRVGLRATGVALTSGETIDADRVVSATDPKRTFRDLVGFANLDIGFANRTHRLRSDGLVGKLHLALRERPTFARLEDSDGRLLIAPSLDAIEFAYDEAKYGEPSQHPVIEITLPSVHDAALAPQGHHVLSAHVMYVPYKHRHGWSDGARDALRDSAISTIEAYAPGLRELIVGAQMLTPQDIEQQFHVTGGHWHHAEFAMDQMLMMRPTYDAAQYRCPIENLFLSSAGCHPGGDLVGSVGLNAAREILR